MTNSITRRTLAGFAVAALIAAGSSSQAGQAEPTKPETVDVTVKYTGKGSVDSNHRIWVWIFETPQIVEGSIPIGEQSIDQNGGTATFKTSAKQVYVAIAYDEAGGFMGQAPPPSGSPVTMYGAKADMQPAPVTPGAKGKIVVSFDDTQRMP